eukprot:scaffold214_cov249-Pinguiococcus_pyrenoidosus.AAC.29
MAAEMERAAQKRNVNALLDVASSCLLRERASPDELAVCFDAASQALLLSKRSGQASCDALRVLIRCSRASVERATTLFRLASVEEMTFVRKVSRSFLPNLVAQDLEGAADGERRIDVAAAAYSTALVCLGPEHVLSRKARRLLENVIEEDAVDP